MKKREQKQSKKILHWLILSSILWITLFLAPDRLSAQSPITGLKSKQVFDSLVFSIATPMYNLKYEETEKAIKNLQKIIPQHPVIDLLYAINITWQTLPEPLPARFDIIKSYLESSIGNSEKWLEKDPENPEAVFFLLMSHGLLAQYYNEQGSVIMTISEAKKSYNAILKGFELKKTNKEFLFPSGLYNYYRERYPQMYPSYKSFTWLFRSGDITAGLQQLDSARKVTVLSRVEAAHYLAYIYLRYENLPRKAIGILVPLVLEFPDNLYFKLLLLEAYMMIGSLEQVSDMIDDLISSDRMYYNLCGNTFMGALYERYKFNDLKAAQFYNSSIQISKKMKNNEIQGLSMAYAGLARISDRNKDIRQAKEYYRLASKFAQSDSVRQEAKTYLKNN